MTQDQGASAKADRAATPSEPSQSSVVSGTAGIPCAFTPGPWAVETHHRQGHDRLVSCWYVLTPHNRVGIATQPAFSADSNAAANACLIATAPDLYEGLTAAANALQQQARMVTYAGSSPELVRKQAVLQEQADAAFAVLAKARGQ